MTRFGWQPVVEDGKIIALAGDDGTVSLEPAGQLELSGAPLETLHQTCAETGRHLKQVKEVGAEHGLGFLGVGLLPDKTRAVVPITPMCRPKIIPSSIRPGAHSGPTRRRNHPASQTHRKGSD